MEKETVFLVVFLSGVGYRVGHSRQLKDLIGFLKEKFEVRDSNSEFRVPNNQIQVSVRWIAGIAVQVREILPDKITGLVLDATTKAGIPGVSVIMPGIHKPMINTVRVA